MYHFNYKKSQKVRLYINAVNLFKNKIENVTLKGNTSLKQEKYGINKKKFSEGKYVTPNLNRTGST